MAIEHYFPTAIFFEKYPDLSTDLLPEVRLLLSSKETTTNHWGYSTTFKVEHGLERLSEFKFFNELIQSKSKEFLKLQGYDVSNLEFTSQIFASNMTVGDSHGLHTHPNALISGIFYLDVEETSAPIIFYDPRPFRKHVALPRGNETLASYEKLMIMPENGLMIIFESWLEHEVPKNESSNRTTLCFNLGRK